MKIEDINDKHHIGFSLAGTKYKIFQASFGFYAQTKSNIFTPTKTNVAYKKSKKEYAEHIRDGYKKNITEFKCFAMEELLDEWYNS